MFERMAIIGFGLIGSSVARVVRKRGMADHISVCARTSETRQAATDLGLADSVHADPAKAVEGADFVLLCTPLGTYKALAEAFAPSLKPGAIVSDVGSVKEAAIRDIGPFMPDGVHFVPGHPVAGTENSGPHAGYAELFDDRWCILTPPEGTDQKAVDTVADFWRQAGSEIEIMDAAHHDLVLAVTSHLPHLIAFNIVGTADDLAKVTESEVIKFAAGGFRDFTRIAASDPVMWRDVFLTNRDAVLEMLGRFTEDLTALQKAIRYRDGDALEALFTRTRHIRRDVIDAGQADPDEAPEN
jgi:cyclohexadieny/prephenate dehydrogenase